MNTTIEHTEVAEIIRQQIGAKALFMIGAKNLTSYPDKRGGLAFKTMPTTTGKANFVKVLLCDSDTYQMTFLRISGRNVKEIAVLEDVYADQLNAMIEAQTGLYTRL